MITKYAQIAKYLPAPLYKILAQAWIDRKFPRHLFIETTATCNLTCSYCPRPKIRSDMDFRLFKKIVDEASCYGPRSFSLHLFGEPMLYPRLLEAIAYIKQKNTCHVVLLTTNGTKFNEFIDGLRESRVDKVLWSWRPEPKWTKETIEKLKNWKAFTVRIIEEVTPPEIKNEFLKWPRIETRRLHNYGANIDLSLFTSAGSNVKNADSKGISRRWPCYHLWLSPAIGWNGKFLMCCADPHQKEVFGDVSKESVSELWQKLERVRQSHLKGKYEGICENCDVWKEYPDIFFKFQHS